MATTDYPLVLENCGTAVTFNRPPARVLAIKSTPIEMMLALGLDDRIVGTAFSDGPAADEWADRAADLPVVDKKVPSREATLDLEPDLIYAGWESNVTTDGAGDRNALASLGVNTYVAPSACEELVNQPGPLTFDDVFGDITEMGRIFDVQTRADNLVALLQKRLDGIEADSRGLTAMWYSSGSDIPFVGAGRGAPQLMMDAAGLTNIAAEIPDSWSSLSWEMVIERDPDVIILVDSAWSPAEKKMDVLQANPATAQLSAVRQHHYLIIPFPSAEAGVRNVEAIGSLTTQLAELQLP